MYKQLKPFDQAKAGKEPLMCLKNTRLGFGIAGKYDNATQSWQGKGQHQHKDRNIPTGVDVPLYYYYKTKNGNEGHINVRLASGKVWSDGQIFNSLADYEAKRVPDFIGWGECVNDVRVIEHVPDPPKPVSATKMPPVGSVIQLLPVDTRTTYKAGTTEKAGSITVIDNSYVYTVRGYDPKYPGRVLINSKSAGGDGVALALYFTDGKVIPGWKQV